MLPGRWNSRRCAPAWSKSDLGRWRVFVCRGVWVLNAPPQTGRPCLHTPGNSSDIPLDPRGAIDSLAPIHQLLSRRVKSTGYLGNGRLSLHHLVPAWTTSYCPRQHNERRCGVVIQLVASEVFVHARRSLV